MAEKLRERRTRETENIVQEALRYLDPQGESPGRAAMELATAINCSLPSIYNWRRGGQPIGRFKERLELFIENCQSTRMRTQMFSRIRAGARPHI